MFKIKKNSDTQKSMKTRSSRMRDLNSSGGLESFASFWWPLPTLLEWEWSGTAISQDFKNVIKDVDPTLFKTLTDAGQGSPTMFDRRTNSFNRVENAHLFNTEYSDGLKFQVQVNPEFRQSEARNYAEQYAKVIGKLPTALRRDVKTVWIHDGDKPFGGGNKSLLIHVIRGDNYIKDGNLEEILIHEASHTSLDSYIYDPKWKDKWKDKWKEAQEKDNKYISTYAAIEDENNIKGGREDIAESFLAYFAVTYRIDKDRISTVTSDKITSTIPNRIKFFDSLIDSLNLDMYPYVKSPLKPS